MGVSRGTPYAVTQGMDTTNSTANDGTKLVMDTLMAQYLAEMDATQARIEAMFAAVVTT